MIELLHIDLILQPGFTLSGSESTIQLIEKETRGVINGVLSDTETRLSADEHPSVLTRTHAHTYTHTKPKAWVGWINFPTLYQLCSSVPIVCVYVFTKERAPSFPSRQ